MPKLYEITDSMNAIFKAIAENDGEITPELEADLKEVKIEIAEKGESIAKMIRNMEGDKVAFKVEAERLSKKGKTIDNKIKWLKDYLKAEMAKVNIRDIEGEIFTIRVRPGAYSCVITDEKAVPPAYCRTIPATQEVNKRAIIEAFKKEDKLVPGAEIARGETLTIR